MPTSPAHKDEWFRSIASTSTLSERTVQELNELGFIVISGPVPQDRWKRLTEAYDSAVASADSVDIAIGSSTTRISDFVNRGPDFDDLYLFPPILEASFRILCQPFKLSTMLGRTLRPHSPAQRLHVDFQRDAKGWPMVGFIYMIDDFRADNGATRFVPGSHKSSQLPSELMADPTADHDDQVLACGSAGSLIIYNGSIWHGHTANQSAQPRRSVQGAFIRREELAADNQRACMLPETRYRVGSLAKYLLDLVPEDDQQGR